jgi:hypothetical protein
MKLDRLTVKHLLNSKNTEAGVYGDFPRWPTLPPCKLSEFYETSKIMHECDEI